MACLVACQSATTEWTPSKDQVARNNQGVALMGQYENETARQVFAALLEEQPDWVDVEVNLAIATLNRQQEGDELRALEIVERVLETHPDHRRARYIAGLMRFYIGESEHALRHFNRLLTQVDDDAHVLYFTAQALGQLARHDEALALYEKAIGIDPYLRSAYYGAALSLRTLGDSDRARELLAVYQRFANNPRAHLAEFRYTRKGVLAEALAIGDQSPTRDHASLQGSLFAKPVVVGDIDLDHVGSLVTADLDSDGWQDLLLLGGEGLTNEVWMGHAVGWTKQDHPLSTIPDVMAAGFADINNDGKLDVYLCRKGPNQWLDVATSQPPPGAADLADAGHCQDLAIFDADHDGDLDVMVINDPGGPELFNNNLNGSFRRLSQAQESNFAPQRVPGRGLVITDFDGDRDLDMVAIYDAPPHSAWSNDRIWRYEVATALESMITSDIEHLVAGDLEADGQMDFISMDSSGQAFVWTAGETNRLTNQAIEQFPIDSALASGMALMDFDGDGRLDWLIHHQDGFSVHRWMSNRSIFESIFEERQGLEQLLPVVHDIRQGPSVVGVSQVADSKTLQWWAPGVARHQFVGIDPSGKSSTADGMRSNASGIGTQVVARVGQHWTLLERLDDYSGPGQSLQPMVLGLGDATFADFIKLYWSDGVLQTEMALEAGEVHRIEEFQRQLASCPVLFTWNGERFDFVSDILGVGGIGFFQSPGHYAEPRPWEYFRFPDGAALPRNGSYPIKITEPMQEIAYIDATWLHLYDLPGDWALAMDERMHTGGGPPPTGTPIFYQSSEMVKPSRVTNDRGEDVTQTIHQVDQAAADPGPKDPRFLGLLNQSHSLELSFDEPINSASIHSPVLWASGWVEYPYSQTVFAAWQSGAHYQSPSLFAYADGEWVLVYEAFGYPAGMPREMTLPLHDLPANTTKLRIVSNLEIYWDALAIIDAKPMPPNAQHHQIAPSKARLSKTGFALRKTLAQARPHYDYDQRQAYWDTHYQSGFYTRLGPVMELVSSLDNALAIIGPGEELHLEFDSPMPIAGTQRTVVLETRGYAKDKDLYTKDGATVGPLPFSPMLGTPDKAQALHDQYLTRYQGGY